MLKFKRLASLTTDKAVITEALKNAAECFMEVCIGVDHLAVVVKGTLILFILKVTIASKNTRIGLKKSPDIFITFIVYSDS